MIALAVIMFILGFFGILTIAEEHRWLIIPIALLYIIGSIVVGSLFDAQGVVIVGSVGIIVGIIRAIVSAQSGGSTRSSETCPRFIPSSNSCLQDGHTMENKCKSKLNFPTCDNYKAWLERR